MQKTSCTTQSFSNLVSSSAGGLPPSLPLTSPATPYPQRWLQVNLSDVTQLIDRAASECKVIPCHLEGNGAFTTRPRGGLGIMSRLGGDCEVWQPWKSNEGDGCDISVTRHVHRLRSAVHVPSTVQEGDWGEGFDVQE